MKDSVLEQKGAFGSNAVPLKNFGVTFYNFAKCTAEINLSAAAQFACFLAELKLF